jgi:phospholipase/carboxylesterase
MMAAARSGEQLVAQGYEVEWHEYPMAHSVCPQEIDDIRRFLLQVLG